MCIFNLKRIFKKFSLLSILVLSILVCLTSCNSHSSEIKKIKTNLLFKTVKKHKYSKDAQGTWGTTYDYNFVNGITLTAKEVLTFNKNGDFFEHSTYYYEGQAMAETRWSGKWDVEYDDALDAYFLIQDYEGSLKVKNINFAENWFNEFETDIRLTRNGDAYDSVDGEDELYGNEIIDCTKYLLLIKDLNEKETYRYTPIEDKQEVVTYDSDGNRIL